MVTTFLHEYFRRLSLNGSLDIMSKPKDKIYNFTWLPRCSTIYRKVILSHIVFQDILPHKISGPYIEQH